MLQYFLNNVDIYYASDDAYVVLLAFLAFGYVNVEYSFKALCPRHPPCMVRFIRLLISLVNQPWTILPSLRSGDLRFQIAIGSEHAELRRSPESG